MTTTDTDALKGRIARALYSHDFPTHIGGWDHARALAKERYADRAAAVLPIVAVEVRAAKAEALREAADSVHDNASSPYCLPCHRDDADLLHTIATEYEQEKR